MGKIKSSVGDDTRKQILEYIKEYMDEHKYAPSVVEIAEAMYFSSTAGIYSHLYKMLVKGMLVADYDWKNGSVQSRAYRIGADNK